MNFQVHLGIVLMSSCGKDICCHDREDSETCLRTNITMLSSTYI